MQTRYFLAYPAMTRYQFSEEFSYAYSKNLQPIQLLYSYGMTFDNNPFAQINIPQNNFMHTFTPKQRDFCLLLNCTDPKYYPD